MKRHPALVALSHDHHQILLLARLVRRPGAVRPRCQAARRFLGGLQAHFRVEEGALQVAAEGAEQALGEALHAAASRHRELEQMIAGLRCSTATAAALVALGDHLFHYVRAQERGLFQELQCRLDGAALAAVAAYLARERDPGACLLGAAV